MATYVKLRGLSRGAGGSDVSVMKGRGIRVPYPALMSPAGVKASVIRGQTSPGRVTFTANQGGTWANGGANAGLAAALTTGAGTGNVVVSVALSGTGIGLLTITVQIDDGVTTAAAAAAAVNQHPVASQLVTATASTAGALTAQAAGNLASGTDSGTGQRFFVRLAQNTTFVVDVDDSYTARALRRADYGYVSLGSN
jgi:hypothetical protein